jgi:hypothetical protein
MEFTLHQRKKHGKTSVRVAEGSRDSSVGIATRYGLEGPGIESRWGEIFRTYPDRLRGPLNPCTMGTGSLPGVKAAEAWCWPHTPSIAEVKKELSYTSTHPMCPPGPVTEFPLRQGSRRVPAGTMTIHEAHIAAEPTVYVFIWQAALNHRYHLPNYTTSYPRSP